MALRTLRKMSPAGDTIVADWNTETVSPERLKAIEKEYNKLIALGYTPVDITDKKDEIVTGRAFNPEADTLMLPRLQGGRI